MKKTKVEEQKRFDVITGLLAEYPKGKTLTLARIAHKVHPLLFDSVEKARSSIRYYLGNNGDPLRKANPHKEMMRPNSPPQTRIPKSRAKKYMPYYLPKVGKILVLNDTHVPYHDMKAVEAALNYADAEKPDLVYLNGDIADFYALSYWEKDPEERNFIKELEEVRKFLKHLTERYSKIIYKFGNHEDRLRRYLWLKAPDLFGLPEIELDNLLHLNELGIESVTDKRIAYAGKLAIVHGHEFMRSFNSPVNPARGLLLKGMQTAMCGHWHRSSAHDEKKMNGKIMATWSVGCLCDMSPQYAVINKWNHGFALISMEGNGFHVTNKKIYNGEVY